MPIRDALCKNWTWVTIAVCVVIGIAYLVAGIAGGDPEFGVFGLLLMLALAGGLLAVRGRSETVQGVLDGRDERINQLGLRATAFAGMVVIAAVIVAAIIEIARGEDPMPYSGLGALGGVAYVGALVYERLRH